MKSQRNWNGSIILVDYNLAVKKMLCNCFFHGDVNLTGKI